MSEGVAIVQLMQYVNRVPIATRREWLIHSAHKLTMGQVVQRIIGFAAIGGTIAVFMWASVMTALSGVRQIPPLNGLDWSSVTPSQWMELVVAMVVLILLLVLMLGFFIKLGIVIVTATGLALEKMNCSIRKAINEGFCRAQNHPDNKKGAAGSVVAILLPLLFYIWVVSVVAEAVFSSVRGLMLPLSIVSMGIASFLIGRVFVSIILDLECLSYSVATLIPALRGKTLLVPVERECVVCAKQRRDRPITVRAMKRLRLVWQKKLLERAVAGSRWAAFVRVYPGLSVTIIIVILLLGLVAWDHLPLTFGIFILSSIVAVATAQGVVRGRSKTMLDALMGDMSRGSIAKMIVGTVVAVVIVGNAKVVDIVVTASRQTVMLIFSGYDENLAAAFFVGSEACVVYSVYAWIRIRFGYRTRWTPRQVVRGSVWTLLGLAIGAISGGWYLVFLSLAFQGIGVLVRSAPLPTLQGQLSNGEEPPGQSALDGGTETEFRDSFEQ